MEPALSLLAEILSADSFLNVWYWIFLAVIWAHLSHYTLGIGHHDVLQAKRAGGEFMADFEAVVEIKLRRGLEALRDYGTLLVGIMAFFLSVFSVTGFLFGFELMQAVAILWFFICIYGMITWRLMSKLEADAPKGQELSKRFSRHQNAKQLIGFLSLLFTVFYGVARATLNYQL